jgi:hypothetical protein
MATMTWGLAIIATTAWGIAPTVSRPSATPASFSPPLLKDTQRDLAVSGPPHPSPNDFHHRATIDLSPSDMAEIFAVEMADIACGETLTWAEIQIQYRRLARDRGWRMEIADRILSKALKDAGAIRGQLDLRKEGKGRPITITFPGLGP